MRYSLTIFLSCVVFMTALGGCKGGGKDKELVKSDELRINIATEPPTLDWSLARDYTSITVIINLMEGLTKFGDGMRPEPSLAESWEVSEDKKTLTFHLRKDVRWTDGKPLRARDFVYSWRRLLDPATGADYAYFLYDVEGAYERNAGRSKDPESIGVRAIDDHTLEVKLKAPASYFLSLLTFVSTFPLREDIVKEHGMSWTSPRNIVTLGPFKLKDWAHHEKLAIVRNDSYWGEKPTVDRVRMIMSGNPSSALALYESGELDFLDGRDIPTLEVPRLSKLPDFKRNSQFRGNYVGFNTKKPPFDNVLVRKAFSAAIDRKSIVGLIQGAGIPTTSWIPKGMLAYNANIGIGHDPEQAKRWLSEAGYTGGKGFPEVSFLYPNLGNNKLIAVALQSMWKRNLGVEVTLNNQEWKVYLSTLKVDPPQIYRAGWGADYPDPHNFMNLFECNSGNNHTRWCSARFDELIELAARETDTEKRVVYYNEAQTLLTEADVAIAPFFISIQYSMIKPYVRGLDINELSLIYLDHVSLDGEGS